ncbi:UbiA prenyltransferase [Schizophyllum commune H4-8]|uniref:UbiA prenyltransferase n=1 Tax=Schizophyllum commune (strain H4-8 / FGSC 9210) TaxID=578458 RepID=UPI0021604854|nr:UbiA prenyltransferase [Schizophyllum commune H4-8]KAI5891015.1 UbiA prenyltransferase [Schizophyllum commune H4-8]
MTTPTETTKLFSPSYQSLAKRDQLKFPLGLIPQRVRPYLELIRFEKPTGTILMFWPFAWGLTMAARAVALPLQEYFPRLLQCLLGAWLIRGSACTVNDIFDRDMDAGVERTRGRPLPSGRISVRAATIYLLVQYALGLAFFYTTLSGLAFYVALFQLLPMFMIYPLLKRVSDWPQAWLGFAMNFGFVTAWITTTGTMDAALLAAAMAGFWSWTMLYDTIYACQDKADDVKVGVRSTALLFGAWIRPLLVALGVMFAAMLALAGYLSGQGVPYYAISVGGTAAHLLWQYHTVDLEEPASCGENFKRNGHLGWIIWGGLFVDYATTVVSPAIVAFI